MLTSIALCLLIYTILTNVLVLFTIYFFKLYLKKILGQRKSKKYFRPIGSKNLPKNLRQKVIFGIQIL